MSLYKVIINKQPNRELDKYEKRYAREKAKLDTKIVSAIGICVCVYLWFCLAFNAF